MLQRIRNLTSYYPKQYMILVFGSLVSAIGSSMIWPFMSIYLRERLGVSLTTVATLLTISSFAGLLSSFVAGTIADRYGRRLVMMVSLFGGVVYYFLMTRAESLTSFAFLLTAWGAINIFYPIGANAMIADLVLPERRIDAYATLRVFHNIGVAIGPVLGGYLNGITYSTTYYCASIAYAFFALLTLLFIRETLPKEPSHPEQARSSAGYGIVLRDHSFMITIVSFTITTMSSVLMFVVLSVYLKENFGMAEMQYGYLVMINAVMCILLQYSIAQYVRRMPALPLLAIGSVFYAVGTGAVAVSTTFLAFAACMVVMTIGELVMTPIATTLVADLAPEDMRGRYMSIFSLSWPVANGIAPFIAGILNDSLAPVAMWYGSFAFGILGAAGFILLDYLQKKNRVVVQPGARRQ